MGSRSEMGSRECEEAGRLGSAARRRWRELQDSSNNIEWRAIRDVLLPTLLDIADELDALRKERDKPKARRGG